MERIVRAGGCLVVAWWLSSGRSLVVRVWEAQARGSGFDSWRLLALHFLLLPLQIDTLCSLLMYLQAKCQQCQANAISRLTCSKIACMYIFTMQFLKSHPMWMWSESEICLVRTTCMKQISFWSKIGLRKNFWSSKMLWEKDILTSLCQKLVLPKVSQCTS